MKRNEKNIHTQVHMGRLELFLREISRREPLYFQYRAREDKDPGWQVRLVWCGLGGWCVRAAFVNWCGAVVRERACVRACLHSFLRVVCIWGRVGFCFCFCFCFCVG